MTISEMQQFIEDEQGEIIVDDKRIQVDILNTTYVGFFTHSDDSEELKKDNKWRFVENIKSVEWRKKMLKVDTIVINGNDVTKLTEYQLT